MLFFRISTFFIFDDARALFSRKHKELGIPSYQLEDDKHTGAKGLTHSIIVYSETEFSIGSQFLCGTIVCCKNVGPSQQEST